MEMFHNFCIGARKTSFREICGPGETDKSSNNYTTSSYVWPEVWSKIGKSTQNREKQEWAFEKPKVDNARQLIGIHFIDPNDEDYHETMKSERKKLETPMAPAMACKKMNRDGFWKRERELIASPKVPRDSLRRQDRR